jgi:hypothetical protein
MNADDFISTPPHPLPPPVWCDFMTCGWSGEAGDDCYYALDAEALNALPAKAGTEVFLFDEEGEGNVLGRTAKLERFEGSWRARPTGLWFTGPRPW